MGNNKTVMQSNEEAKKRANARSNYAKEYGTYNKETKSYQIKKTSDSNNKSAEEIVSSWTSPEGREANKEIKEKAQSALKQTSKSRGDSGMLSMGYGPVKAGSVKKSEQTVISGNPFEKVRNDTQSNLDSLSKKFDEATKKLNDMYALNSKYPAYKVYSDEQIKKQTKEVEQLGNIVASLHKSRGETEEMYGVRSKVSNALYKVVDKETPRSIDRVTIPESVRQQAYPEYDDALFRKKADDIAVKYIDKEYRANENDVIDFFSKWMANYSAGKLGEAYGDSGYSYASKPTDARKYYKDTVENVQNVFTGRNSGTVGKGGVISKNLASYLPQLEGQVKNGLPLALIGGAIGMAVGAPALGVKLGYSLGVGRYSYEQMYGMSFNNLSKVTDYETAKKLARDEGLVSGGVETLDTLWDIASLGGGAVLKALGKETVKEIGKTSLLKLLGGYALNVIGEGGQESVQELISIANERRAQKGNAESGLVGLVGETVSLINEIYMGKNDAALNRAKEAGIEGMKTSAVIGGASLALNTATANVLGKNNGVGENQKDDVYFLIDEKFESSYDKWVKDGKPNRKVITVGETSDALKSIGVNEQTIKWDTSEINRALKKHKYLDDSILKQIPTLIENPIIVMQSKQSDSRITMFGEVYDIDGLPIMTVLELAPKNRKGTAYLDIIKITSTHSRKSKNPNKPADITQTQSMIDTSDILYVEPNKKRTDNWLTLNRLQLPLSVTNYGSIKSVTYPDGYVNTYDMQKNKNDVDDVSTSVQSVGNRKGTPADAKSKEKFKTLYERLGYSVISKPNPEVTLPKDKKVDGYVDHKRGEVYIAPDSENGVYKHELMHIISRMSKRNSQSFLNFCKKNVAEWDKLYKENEKKYNEIRAKDPDFVVNKELLEQETIADLSIELAKDEVIEKYRDSSLDFLGRVRLWFRILGNQAAVYFGKDSSQARKVAIAKMKWELALASAKRRNTVNHGDSIQYARKFDRSKKTVYNEYRTNALKWARNTDRRIGDVTILNANGKYFALIEATEDGFIELRTGNYEEVHAEYERIHSEKDTSFYEDIEEIRTEQDTNLWDLQHVGHGRNDDRNGGQARSERIQSDTAGSNEHLRSGNKGKHVDDDSVLFSVSGDSSSAEETVSDEYESPKRRAKSAEEILDEIDIVDELLNDSSIDAEEKAELRVKKKKLERSYADKRRSLSGELKSLDERTAKKNENKEESVPPFKYEEAVKTYKETGDSSGIPDKKSARMTQKYYAERADSALLALGDVEGDLAAGRYSSETERLEMETRRDALKTQWREAVSKNEVMKQVLDILDEIDTAARPNHTWLRDVAINLSDKQNIIKDGLYKTNDVERNFRNFFGKYFKTAYEKVLKPFYDSKKNYAEGVEEYAKRLREEIVDSLMIKAGSRESAAVMWLGEGRKPINKKAGADLADYTYEDCVKEFGEKRASDIKKASEIFRKMYDELLDKVNETRAKIYPNNPDKLVEKRKDYFHHFQEMGQGFSGLRNILNTNIGIDPMLVGTSEHTKPKSKWQGYMQRRLGEQTEYDAVMGFFKYLPAAQYSIHIDPNIVNFRSLAYDLASAKASENNGAGNPNANVFIEYLQKYANSLAGKTVSNADRGWISYAGRTSLAVISWLNNMTKASAVLGNVNSVLAQLTNVKNMIGKISHQDDALRGALEALAGINPKSEIASRYNESGFLKERFLDKHLDEYKMSAWNFKKVMQTPGHFAAWMLGFADEIGTRVTWNAAYNEAIRKNIKDAAQYADSFTRQCVAGRGIGEDALVFKSQMVKLFLPFRIEPLNDIRMLQDILFGKEYDIWEKNGEKKSKDVSKQSSLTQKIKGVVDKIVKMPEIFKVTENVLESFGEYKNHSDKIYEYFKSVGGSVEHPVLGKIDLGKSGAKATITHGFGGRKLLAVGAIKDICEKGEIVDHQEDWNGKGFDTYVLVGHGSIVENGKDVPCAMGVIVKSYPKGDFDNKFYVHEVVEIKNEKGSPSATAINNDVTRGGNPSLETIISHDEGKSKSKVFPKGDRFDEIVAMGDMDSNDISPKKLTRVKNIMQLFVASAVINAVIAAIKSDEFDPLDEAEEGFEENGVFGALESVMKDYADGIGDPVAFDPIYDIATGVYQGITEGESIGGKVGKAALRVGQNLLGDAVSNNPFSTVAMSVVGIDSEASDFLFNGNVYTPGGMGMPLAGNVTRALDEALVDEDYWSAAVAIAKGFVPMGTQIDRSVKGLYDYKKGYATNEAAYERMAGQDGDLKYLIEPDFWNGFRSLLFGSGAFSKESDAFYNEKSRKFNDEEQAEILSHSDYETRKVTFDDILAMNKYESKEEKDKRKEERAKEFFDEHSDGVLYNLYLSGEDAAIPYKGISGETSYTDSKTKKKYTLKLKAEEAEKLTREMSDRIAQRFARAESSESFEALSREEQVKYLDAVADSEYKQAKVKALYDSGQMGYEDYYRLEANYKETEAKRDRFLYVNDASVQVEFNAADVVGQYITYSDVPISEEGIEQLNQWYEYSSNRKPDDVDSELMRLSSVTGSDINVSGNVYGVISYEKNGVNYKIAMPDNKIYALCDEVDKAVRSALYSLFEKATYKSATVDAQKDMVASVKRKVRDGIKDKYKARYKSVRVTEFDKIIAMK